MKFEEYASPCGNLLLGVHGSSLCLCDWIIGDRIEKTLHRLKRFLPAQQCEDDLALIDVARLQLDEYFAGNRLDFSVSVTALGSEFQRRVWEVLPQIPYGRTASYKDIADRISCSNGVRAVASAIGANPLSILIPCHRIIGSGGTLNGYAGGLEAKRYLLQLEAKEL